MSSALLLWQVPFKSRASTKQKPDDVDIEVVKSPLPSVIANVGGRLNGSPISMVEYANSFHGFDDPGAGEETRLDIPNVNKDPPLGATLGYNGEAHADAKERVKLFLSQNLSAK